MSSHDLLVERDVFDNAGNPKNIDFPQGKCIFLQNLIFRIRCEDVSKMIQNVMVPRELLHPNGSQGR